MRDESHVIPNVKIRVRELMALVIARVPHNVGNRLGAFLIPFLSSALFAVGTARASDFTIEQVALSTDEVPGGGATYHDLRPPSVNAAGAVAFNDGFGGAIYTTAHRWKVKKLRRAVGMGDVPPGILGSFGSVAEPSLNDDGSFAFRGEGQDSSNRGIYIFLAKGDLKLIVDASVERPGSEENFSADGPGSPLASDGGHLVFSHIAVFDPLEGGVYRADFDASAIRVYLTELLDHTGFMSLPGGEDPLGYAINDAGAVAMVLQRLDFTRGIYLALPNGNLRLIVAEGDLAPDGGSFESDFGAISVNGTNSIAFCAHTTGSESGIFVCDAGGEIKKVFGNTTPVPNHPETKFSRFRNVHLADDGTIIFQGEYSLPDGRDFTGLYKGFRGRLTVIFDQFDGIVVDGQRVSLQEDARLSLSPRFAAVVNGASKVAFLQELPAGRDRPTGIFIALEK